MKHSPAFLKLVDEVRQTIRESDTSGLSARMQDPSPFELIDVREESEYRAGHIPGATWLGKGIIERDIEGMIPDKGAEIWLYCGGGYRSVLAADNLQRMGYTRVVSVDGGFRGWLESGGATELPAQEA